MSISSPPLPLLFQNARYVVYRYQNKKAKLWRGLEKKYDVPVFLENEWEDWVNDQKKEDESDEHEDLDEEEDSTTNDEEQEL